VAESIAQFGRLIVECHRISDWGITDFGFD